MLVWLTDLGGWLVDWLVDEEEEEEVEECTHGLSR